MSESEVIHHLKLCSFENWVGTDQHRHAKLDLNNDTLILSTAPVLTEGRIGGNRVTWKRVISMPQPKSAKVAADTPAATDAIVPDSEIRLLSQRIRGVLAPVVTPFKADLSPDQERFIKHCRWLLSQNCGLAPFGTTSEANSLSKDERMSLLDALLADGIDSSRMMPGTGCCSITETVELTAHAVKQGCAGVLMLPPFYYKDVSEEGLYRYFSEVVQRAGDARLRIYLYHIPPIAMVGMTPRLVERLLKAYPGTIAGMKDSSGDWNNTKTFLDAFAGDGFEMFVGSETFLLGNLRNGGVGTISATANVNPAAIHELYAACTRNQTSDIGHLISELEQCQVRLNIVRDVFTNGKFPSMIAALKQAIAIYANDPEWARVRPPLVELTADQAERLAEQLRAIGVAMNGIRN